MKHTFDDTYWDNHWATNYSDARPMTDPNPYLDTETSHLAPGTALDVGCGTGAESIWLADQGWAVTGLDISTAALSAASHRTAGPTAPEWFEHDVTTWVPGRTWDLVMTHYVHTATGQIDLYRRIAPWVSPGGTLLIVGHDHDDHEHAHPAHASATIEQITSLLTAPDWRIDAAYRNTRTVNMTTSAVDLHDVVVRAVRTQ